MHLNKTPLDERNEIFSTTMFIILFYLKLQAEVDKLLGKKDNSDVEHSGKH
jgi:hypothetical protein